jgi:CRISPR/Cas system-associated protein Cas10 (large subunit of type III CRISPR-Cas system)
MSFRIWYRPGFRKIEKYVKLTPKTHYDDIETAGYWYNCPVCGEITNIIGCEYEKKYHIQYFTKEEFMRQSKMSEREREQIMSSKD